MKNDVPVRIIRVFKLLEYLSAFPAKSVDKLAQMIGASIKTIYKDIILLESLGYEMEKDNTHRYRIKYGFTPEYHLNENEKKMIIGAISQAGLSKTDITSIQHKIKSFSFTLSDQAIAKQIHIIKKIVDAIAQNQRLLLHDYQSTTAGSKIRDRQVIPLHFDDMRMSITAYDIEKQKCQIFKVARIKDISPIHTTSEKVTQQSCPMVDSFGYAGDMDYEISLLLSQRASALLSEEFHMSRHLITEYDDEQFPYCFTSKVCGYEGVGRFVLGLMTEIKVSGDDGFKAYLKNKILESTLF